MTRSTYVAAVALGVVLVSLVLLVTSVERITSSRFADYTVRTETLRPRGVAIVLAAPGHSRGLKDAMLAANYVVLAIDPVAWRAWHLQRHLVYEASGHELARWGAALGHRYGLDAQIKPILAGGPTEARELVLLAARAPLFHALITIDFCPSDLPFSANGPPASAPRAIGVPWYAFERTDAVCTPAAERVLAEFTDAHLTKVVGPPLAAPEFDALLQWLDPSRGTQTALAGALNGLPLIEVDAADHTTSDFFAVFLSGDGGWAELDQQVAKRLATQGVPVVGWDSLSYYWRARSPEGAASDLAEIIRHYAEHWHKSQVVLVGYSFGADVLPFLINRLPPDVRRRIALATVVGLAAHASFEFHLQQWLEGAVAQGPATAPELARLAEVPLLCIAGADDDEARCPTLVPPNASLILPGDHHFDGDYAGLARAILGHLDAQ